MWVGKTNGVAWHNHTSEKNTLVQDTVGSGNRSHKIRYPCHLALIQRRCPGFNGHFCNMWNDTFYYRWLMLIGMGLNLLMWRRYSRQNKLTGQHFHLYLIAYGIFRFAHEFWRATPDMLAGLSGYQITALFMVCFAVIRFRQRQA